MQKRTALSRLFLIAGAVVVIALIVLGVWLLRSKMFDQAEITVGPSLAATREQTAVYPLGNSYLVKSQEGLTHYNHLGESGWTYSFSDPQALVSVGANYVAVCENQQMTVYNAQGANQYTKSLNLTPSQVVGATNYIALSNELSDTIYVLTAQGANLFNVSLEGQTALSFGFYGEQEYLWVLTMDVSGTEPVTTVNLYDPATKANIGMHRPGSDLLYRFIPDRNGSFAYAVGTQQAYRVPLDSVTEPSQSVLVYGYQYVASTKNAKTPALLLAPSNQCAQGVYRSLRVVRQGEALNVRLPADCTAVVAGEKNFYALNASTIYTLDYTGKLTARNDLAEKYDSVLVLDANKVLYYTDATATVIALP